MYQSSIHSPLKRWVPRDVSLCLGLNRFHRFGETTKACFYCTVDGFVPHTQTVILRKVRQRTDGEGELLRPGVSMQPRESRTALDQTGQVSLLAVVFLRSAVNSCENHCTRQKLIRTRKSSHIYRCTWKGGHQRLGFSSSHA